MTETSPSTDLVALAPGDMPAAQTALLAWCDARHQELATELKDLEEHQLIATGNGWKLTGLAAAIRRTERRITYYAKMRTAVEEGYLMVPNFPITVLAVRVKKTRPKHQTATSVWSGTFRATPDVLPAGEGLYVDDTLTYRDESYDYQKDDGTKGHKSLYVVEDFDSPDFPFVAVKPEVMRATERAMALRLFDRIGMVENTRGRDPIMVGQLIDPRGNGRLCTFFIAWWLDARSL